MINIPVLYHVEDMERLKHIGDKEKSNAIDLYTAEDVIIYKGTRAMISCGISIDLPEGFKAELRPRSSTFKNFGLLQTNGFGLIDTAFSGVLDVIHMPVYAPIQKTDLDQYMRRTLELFCENLGNINVKYSDSECCEEDCEKSEKCRCSEIKEHNSNIINNILSQVELETIPITIPKGTRLCQLEILPIMPDVNFIDTKKEDWKGSERGGFGSTGK